MPIPDELAFNNQLHNSRLALWLQRGDRDDHREFGEWVDRLRQSGFRIAWLELAEQQNSPQTFILSLAAALAAACPELRQALAEVLGENGAADVTESMILLLNLLTDLDGALVIILHGYQTIQASSIHAAVQLMLDHLPPQAHLLIASLAPLPLEIARWRVRGEVLEIGPMR